MTAVELMRAEACVRVVSGEFSVAQAALRVGVSYRQMKRLLCRYRKRGAAGLVHRGLGRSSNRSRPMVAVRARALDLIRAHYSGPPDRRFGPTLAAEHLESEHGLQVCSETLRLWMLEAGLWSLSRRRKPYRHRRERRAHFGELVQVDGSFHDWLEDRGPPGCLITYIDDSRSQSLARFADAESTWAVAEVLELWIARYGVPRGLYVDGGSVFWHRGKGQGKVWCPTQFARMCNQLGVGLIHARSPQAKGRVERAHGTHQDRLVKKMRLAGISNYAEANEFLELYLSDHNERFSVASGDAADFHLPLSESIDLTRVLSIHSQRIVSLDYVVCYNRRRFQLTRTSRSFAGQRVSVEESRDRRVRIFAAGAELAMIEITARPSDKPGCPVLDHGSVHRRPSDDHPWRFPGYDRTIAQELRRQRSAQFHPPPAEPLNPLVTT